METLKSKQRFIVIVVLAIIVFSTLAGEASAASLFDAGVALRYKADARLRADLPAIQGSGTRIGVIVVFSTVPTGDQLRAVESIGRVRSFTGHVATVDVEPGLLGKLATLSFVERISKPRILQSSLDTSVPEILADRVWDTLEDPEGVPIDGSGVVVGIVDSGIDYLHKDFLFRNGTNKILYIWDQSVEGRPPSAFDYGNECTPGDVQNGSCTEVDGGSNGQEAGHGTAVAAVAASTGQSAAGFESCFLYTGTRWFDVTPMCQVTNLKPFSVLTKPGDSLYIGSRGLFNKVFFDLNTGGDYESLTWEFSRGSGAWAKLPNDTISVESQELSFVSKADATASLSRNGTFAFSPPTTWKQDTVNELGDLFWLRISTQEVNKPATAYRVLKTPSYRGTAPGASIIAVKLRSGAEDNVLDGMNYVIQKARELGRPLVIDHSLGDSLGSHDGTEPLELAMTDMAQDGVPIVVAAGNSRNLNLHARGKLSPGQSMTVYWSISDYSRRNSIDLWYPGSDNIGISVRTPSGVLVSGPTQETGVDTPDGNIQVLPDQRSTGKEWWIDIAAPPGKDLQISPWSLILTGTRVSEGRWDAWVEPGQFVLNSTMSYIIDPQDTIDYPGTARGVITVGSYETKLYWRSGCDACIASSMSEGKHGIWWTPPPAPEVGALAYSSSMGPTRDGRMKPDITAPGAQIIAARSSTRQPKNSDPDDYHQVWRGTSFAAPHVVGVIALMLQMNPYLSPNEIRTILTQDARQDQFTGKIDPSAGSPLWGWGKVDSLRSSHDAPSFYSVRLEIGALRGDFEVTVSLDGGESEFELPLSEGAHLLLEFRPGGTHTVELKPDVIEVSPGVRYIISGTPWSFSSGAVKRFDYRLQYYLDVTSPYGYAIGTGWYDANATATAGVYPIAVQGFRFDKWTGSVTSTQSSVRVTMDSQKRLEAQWVVDNPVTGPPSPNIYLIATLLVVVAAAGLVFLIKTRRGNLSHAARTPSIRPAR